MHARASVCRMSDLGGELDALALKTGFSGVVRIDQSDRIELARAYGLAHRGFGIPNAVDTRFGLASGAKGFTALAVVSLIEEGVLELWTPARSVLGGDLPLIDDGVTVEHLLSHRSGIGDYLDEEAGFEVEEYVMPVPVHELATIEDYLAVLDGHSSKFAPGEQFAYCNAGYVVLALIAERASGMPFHELVEQRVCRRAGLTDTAFLRSDELAARTALGYVEVDGAWRSNVFHLPVRGSGDGGISPRPRTWALHSGGRSSPVGSSPRTGSRRWFGRAATRRNTRSATGWASGSTRRATPSSWRGTTRVSRSGPCTIRAHA